MQGCSGGTENPEGDGNDTSAADDYPLKVCVVSGEELGQFGEIDPAVGHEFGLRSPIHAGEFDIEVASRLIQRPVN